MMPQFVEVELHDGFVFARTERGDVYRFSMSWEEFPLIELTARSAGSDTRKLSEISRVM